MKYSLGIVVMSLVTLSGFLFPAQPVFAAPTDLPTGFTATQLIDYNMIAPTGVKVAPDGRIFVFDLFGGIKIFTEGSGFNSTPFGSVAVDASGDRGLLGAVFDTDFANHPYVYLHYVGTDSKVRIGRFDATGNVGSNFTVLYTAPLASGYQHAGGGITMDATGHIFFGIGDSGTPTNSQDMTSSHGKIHRIYRDGSVPTNPYAGQAGVASTTYATGLRNPFRLTFDPVANAVYVGDVGFNTWEEVNLVEAGKNYGWALQEGPCASTCIYENPRYWYAHQFGTNNTNDASILLGPVYRGNVYPAAYQGRMFVSDYVQGFMRTIDPTIATTSFNTLSTSNGTVIDMDVAPNGKLYFITISSPRLYRLDYTGGNVNQAPTAVAGANTTTGAAPLSVNFSSVGSTDPEGTPLTYLWDFGDGSTSTAANPNKIYTATGEYSARLTVSDGVNSTQSSIITITVGNAPILNITAPLGTNTYRGGNVVSYAASGIDTNGVPLPNSSITTTVRLHHSDHSHPFAGPFVGGTGSVTAPVDGELSPDVWLRFIFEATGANGVKTIREVDVYPQLSQITVTTNPAGLNVILDGSNHVIPPTVQGVIGMNRQIAAPSPQVFGGKQYVFDYWSDGGAREHTFSFPETNTTYTAHFIEATTTTSYVNLLANGSFENNGTLPTNWFFSRWGANNAMASLSPDARTGSYSARLSAEDIITGDGRLYHTPVPITPNTVYSVQYYRKTTVPFKAVADVTLENNTHQYIWLGITQPTTNWTDQNWSFTAPPNSKNVVVNLYLTTPGSMQIDDFSLFDPLVSTSTPVVPPPVATTTAPTLSFTAASTSLSLGATTMLTWNATGTAPTCIASGGWTGAKASAGSEFITPATTTIYTLTCSNALGTTTQSVTVTVIPPTVIVPPTVTNLIPNPSFEEHDDTDRPIGWTIRRWGTNDAVMEHEHGDAYDDHHSLTAVITNHTSGEAGWISDPITVTPDTKYFFSEFAKSSGPTKVQVEITRAGGGKQYLWLGRLQNSTDWTEFTKSFTTPNDAVTLRVLTYVTGIGSLTIDSVSLVSEASLERPKATLTSNVSTLPPEGGNVILFLAVTGENVECTLSGGYTGTIVPYISPVIFITETIIFTVTCTNPYGSDEDSVTVEVEDETPPPPPPPPSSSNLITPNTEWTSNNPAGWIKGGWGTNTTDFSVATTGRTDSSALRITITNHESGDAKWIFEPAAITASSTYTFSHWYKTDAPTQLVAEFTLADNSKSHRWLGNLGTQSDWTQNVLTLTPPADVTKVTIHHVIKGNGTLEIDDLSLTAN